MKLKTKYEEMEKRDMGKKNLLRESRQTTRKSSDAGNSMKGFVRISLCAVSALAVSITSKLLPYREEASISTSIASVSTVQEFPYSVSESDVSLREMKYQLPPGITGVVLGMEEAFSADVAVRQSGNSFEYIRVGPYMKGRTPVVSQLSTADSMNLVMETFEQKVNTISAAPTMMSDTDYYNLLKIVEAEAGTEDIKGRVLVANVIMNRVRHEEFPDTITEVIWQSNNGVAQFSPTYDGRIYSVTVSDETREAVKQALEGIDYSEGALFFIMKSAADPEGIAWFEKELVKLFQHGVHEFYRYPREGELL